MSREDGSNALVRRRGTTRAEAQKQGYSQHPPTLERGEAITWPEWAEIVGGQFLYQPMASRGKELPDSGYRLDVRHTVTPVLDHPITAGIEPFDLVDELYLAPVFEDSITPLFRSDYEFVDSNFYSASRALEGKLNDREGWTHPPGSNVVGWLKTYEKSPIVYLQFGDGPTAYGDEMFRRVLGNAIRWAANLE